MALVVVGSATVWFVLREPTAHRLTVRTYLRTTQNLKPDAMVKVDGVSVGAVKAVDLRPEFGERPVEVLMELRTPYELQIPSDSIASIYTDGVLGPTYVEIDTRQAVGPSLADGSTVKSRESEVTNEQGARAMEEVGTALIEESRKLRQKGSPSLK
jgi:ABC-type transporter Mla subunit MlaD